MYCSNCGAEISEHDAYCPYCGVMNVRAAEKEYMEKLEDIREDTEDLGEESDKQTRIGMRHAGKRAVKIFAIVAIILAAFFLIGVSLDRFFLEGDTDYVKQEAAFKAKYFDKLDEYYEAGDDDATAQFMMEISAEDGSSVLSMWKHYEYVCYFMDYHNISGLPHKKLDDTFWKYDYSNYLYDGIELIYQTKQGRQKVSGEDKKKVTEYGKEAEEIFAEYLSLDKATLDEIYEDCMKDGRLYYTDVDKWAEKTGGNRS